MIKEDDQVAYDDQAGGSLISWMMMIKEDDQVHGQVQVDDDD